MIMDLHVPLPRSADDGEWWLSDDGTFVREEFPKKRVGRHHQSISRATFMLVHLRLLLVNLLLLLLDLLVMSLLMLMMNLLLLLL